MNSTSANEIWDDNYPKRWSPEAKNRAKGAEAKTSVPTVPKRLPAVAVHQVARVSTPATTTADGGANVAPFFQREWRAPPPPEADTNSDDAPMMPPTASPAGEAFSKEGLTFDSILFGWTCGSIVSRH